MFPICIINQGTDLFHDFILVSYAPFFSKNGGAEVLKLRRVHFADDNSADKIINMLAKDNFAIVCLRLHSCLFFCKVFRDQFPERQQTVIAAFMLNDPLRLRFKGFFFRRVQFRTIVFIFTIGRLIRRLKKPTTAVSRRRV